MKQGENKGVRGERIEIVEGRAKLISYKGKMKRGDTIFYNPKSKLNRDLGVVLLRVMHKMTGRTFRVIDVMAATGVRGIRYVLEGRGVKEVVFNDINPIACDIIRENVKKNKIEGKVKVVIENDDANVIMNKYRFLGDVVALDPFGSAVYYLEALARCSANKSFVSVVFTDTAVLCGTYPEVTRRRYNTRIVKKVHTPHEIAIRIALKAVAVEMAKFDKAIKPLISVAREHYVALYLEVSKSKSKVKEMMNNLGYVHYCSTCYYKEFSATNEGKQCKYCGGEMISIGELWIGKIHSREVIELANKEVREEEGKELKKVINIIKEESSVEEEEGKYYDLHKLAKHHKTKVMSNEMFKKYIETLGYKVARSHISPTTIITNAPFDEIIEVIKREKMVERKESKGEEREKKDVEGKEESKGKIKVVYVDIANTLIFGGKIDDGVEKTLKELKRRGYAICTISHLDRQEIVEMLEGFGVYDYFDVIISARDYDMLKPDPRLINIANALLKDKFERDVDKKASWLIGDRPDVDIKLGRLAGIKTIRVRKGNYQHVEPEDKYEVPHYEVKAFKEILDILDKKAKGQREKK